MVEKLVGQKAFLLEWKWGSYLVCWMEMKKEYQKVKLKGGKMVAQKER